jgi:ketosteroid isomerase-like protein
MPARDVVESFWAAMRANDWDRAAALFADDAVIEWPCSGERMKGPRAVAFSDVAGERIARQVEYWPEAYEPPAWRADFVERIEPIP